MNFGAAMMMMGRLAAWALGTTGPMLPLVWGSEDRFRAELHRLGRRAVYGGRKGRSAARKLRDKGARLVQLGPGEYEVVCRTEHLGRRTGQRKGR